ncbi:aldo/keto reductase [Scatolibacter rhodanostii]|uniref:aldo/keto reductase n=1 Tax=Scatolibacter rhodanostii TaxID=2014781 RepID=UPI000C076312|nr:aldo/keto reductase [Scatolibacter rhodanostii]
MSEAIENLNIKKLGFGLMRPPMIEGEVDVEQVKKMVDTYMSKGFSYFDTAYVYLGGKSEELLKEAVVKRYPRESFQTADKLPIWGECNSYEDMERIFHESLQRTGLSFFDFYLLHSLDQENYRKTEKLKAWDFVADLKKQGKVSHMGFSFHDNAELLDEILTAHPEAEFVQLQINYVDWENDVVQSRKCYEVARKHNKPIIIMEPIRGGALAEMTPDIQTLFKEVNPDASIASWAMRYAASLEGVLTVLSGMSDREQMEDNCSYLENFEPLSEREYQTIGKAVDILNSLPTIPCTACQYCVDGCPMNINIPGIFDVANFRTRYNNLAISQKRYTGVIAERGAAADCIACGACESHCPQHIAIIDELSEITKLFA